MHENYHADTGAPLAAPDFISWNLLVAQMIEEAQTPTFKPDPSQSLWPEESASHGLPLFLTRLDIHSFHDLLSLTMGRGKIGG